MITHNQHADSQALLKLEITNTQTHLAQARMIVTIGQAVGADTDGLSAQIGRVRACLDLLAVRS